MPDSAQVAKALRGAIVDRGPLISQAMLLYGPYSLNAVVDYWKPDPPGTDYPIVMMQHVGEDFGWIALPNIYRTVYQFDIFGLVRGEEPEVLARTIEIMAGTIKDTFFARNMSLQLDDGSICAYVDVRGNSMTPISNLRYIEAVSQSGTLSRGFRMRWQGAFDQGAPDEYAYTNSLILPAQI